MANKKMMNLEVIKLNLKEAVDELNNLSKRLSTDKDFSEEEFVIGLAHAYHHLNFSWNARNMTDKEYEGMSDEDFVECSRFSCKNRKIWSFG